MRARIQQLGTVGRLAAVSFLITAAAGGGLWLVLDRQVQSGAIGATVGGSAARIALVLGVALAVVFACMVMAGAYTLRGMGRRLDRHQFEALHDPLTGLPNRTLFDDRVAQCVRERQRGGYAALMIVDLDHFKELNNALGQRSGDLVLEEIARRLSSRLRRSDTVARLRGDQFGILLPLVDGKDGAVKVAVSLRKAVGAPFDVEGVSVTLSASVGLAMIHEQSDRPDRLLQHADRAVRRAKRSGSGHAMYDARTDSGERDQLALVGELRRGIARGELRLHYQPKAELSSRRIRSVEALVRWEHPTRGLLAPNVFVPLAERSGLIRPLTYWVLDEAMRQARAWAETGRAMKVAVNLSQQSLLDETMPAEIARVLERNHVPPRALEIEITESALVSDLRAANEALTTLDKMGVSLSIDDYGTGYSSLAHVRGLPVNCIKIDRSFVSGMLTSPKDATIVRSTIELARDLGIGVVAEGVERMEEWDALAGLGCHLAQGFLISEPKPGEELVDWLGRIGFTFRMDASVEAATPLPDFA